MSHGYDECIAGSHPCMKHKLQYWRNEGIGIAPMPEDWNGPTVREQLAEMHALADANGTELEYKGRAELI